MNGKRGGILSGVDNKVLKSKMGFFWKLGYLYLLFYIKIRTTPPPYPFLYMFNDKSCLDFYLSFIFFLIEIEI